MGELFKWVECVRNLLACGMRNLTRSAEGIGAQRIKNTWRGEVRTWRRRVEKDPQRERCVGKEGAGVRECAEEEGAQKMWAQRKEMLRRGKR